MVKRGIKGKKCLYFWFFFLKCWLSSSSMLTCSYETFIISVALRVYLREKQRKWVSSSKQKRHHQQHCLSNEGSSLQGLTDPLKCQQGQLSSFVIGESSLLEFEPSLPSPSSMQCSSEQLESVPLKPVSSTSTALLFTVQQVWIPVIQKDNCESRDNLTWFDN